MTAPCAECGLPSTTTARWVYTDEPAPVCAAHEAEYHEAAQVHAQLQAARVAQRAGYLPGRPLHIVWLSLRHEVRHGRHHRLLREIVMPAVEAAVRPEGARAPVSLACRIAPAHRDAVALGRVG